MPDKPLESNITKSILKYLRGLDGCFAWKEHGGMYGTTGIPDVICCYQGMFLAFEVKRPGNKPTMIQQAMIDKMRQAGGKVYIVNSVKDVRGIISQLQTERSVVG